MNSKLYEIKQQLNRAKEDYRIALKAAMENALIACGLNGDLMISRENALAIAKKKNVKHNGGINDVINGDKKYYRGVLEVQTYCSEYQFFFKSTEKHETEHYSRFSRRDEPYRCVQAYIRLTGGDEILNDMEGFVREQLGAYYEPYDESKMNV